MARIRRHSNQRSLRRAWTLLELLTAIAIFAILTGAVLIGGNAVRNSRRGATAKQQLKLIAAAIDAYASFWPKWQIGGVVIADQGWPDFVPGRVFGSCARTFGPYTETPGFNDTLILDMGNPSWIDNGDLTLNANTSLVFELLATSGKGPFIHDRGGANLRPGNEFMIDAARDFYPRFDSACVAGSVNALRHTEVLVDPWGTPMRYFWVYRDASNTSYRGYLPVDFGPVLGDASPAGVQSADFQQAASTAPQTAVGFVLESAGPDKKFGNVWKIDPTESEKADAADNVMVTP